MSKVVSRTRDFCIASLGVKSLLITLTVDVLKWSSWFLFGQLSSKKSKFDQRKASRQFSECGPRPGSIGLPWDTGREGRSQIWPRPAASAALGGAGHQPPSPCPMCDAESPLIRELQLQMPHDGEDHGLGFRVTMFTGGTIKTFKIAYILTVFHNIFQSAFTCSRD